MDLENLALVDDEILSQQRQFHRLADVAQVFEVALKEFLVGEHRQAGGPGLFVFDGDLDGIKVLADHPGGRRGLFDFGDQRQLAASRLTQGGQEIAPLTLFQQGVAQISGGDDPLRQLRHLAPLFFDDGIQNGHGHSSSFNPCIRLVGQPARSQPFTNGSRSPSITPCVLLFSTPVRRSLTRR